MGKRLDPPGSSGGDHVEPIDLKAALEERYLAYALSTIMHRALPDVRDGLKPVHRRIVHAMRLLRLNPEQGFAKCAKIVGEVMGNFHPHGDQSIYDALVRLAQDFSMRYPLVDGQGNFGNIDGDSAAAMRYTEARMTEAATALLEGITEDAVDFRPTYNEEDEEPSVLPGAFPNLLANGSSGIAVGMATSIPPHNAAELCDAALHLIDHRDADTAKLLEFVQGPDFPTGGIIVEERSAIREAYETGRGGFRVRARWSQEDQGRGTWNIVVTEIPYGVQKARLIEKIAELLIARKLPLLEDIRDESAEDIRVVLTPKSRTVDPGLLMESLFKLSELEVRFPLNMNVLSRGKVPNVLSLRQALLEWLDHRREVLIRRSRHRLAEIERRLEILGGYLIAYLNIDEVIRIIREEDEPKQVMMARWGLTDAQAEAILNMRLRALRKLEEFEIRKEFDALSAEKKQTEDLLGSEAKQWATVKWEVAKIREKYGPETELGRRRTTFADAPDHDLTDIQQAMIEKEPVTVIISEKGWLRALKGHLTDHSALGFKEGDSLKLAFHAQTTDKIIVFTTGGKFYTIGADRLPGGRGHGEPIRIIVDMENDQDIVTAFVHDPARRLLLVSHEGYGFLVPESEVIANTRKGKQVMNVKTPDEATRCVAISGDHVAIVGENRKMLIFPLAEVPEMARGKGVRLQRYKDGGVLDVKTFALDAGLSWQD
ncbi:MAG: DNA topoisomerase IV subunit A, partial [Rhizobiaceae bacterium]|nr:DNA topoisomerase IV subunit A [Rhizobiaceae bacterium]